MIASLSDLPEVSRTIAHALRHEPAAYGLQLDAEGWAPLDDLLAALQGVKLAWAALDRDDITRMMALARKQRYEVAGGRIRAAYGHSAPARSSRTAAQPPALLYHGTAPGVVAAILREGLRPMGRQQVHLSADQDTARQVGKRKASRPALLGVDAAAASAAGVLFYPGGGPVWLADAVPGHFLRPLGPLD